MLHQETRFQWLLLAAMGVSGLLLLNSSAAAFPQTPTTTPLRIGDFARTLSDKDILDIEGTLAGGGKPWLLEGPVGQIGFSVLAYLPPETQTRELRRGQAIMLMKRPGDSTWTKRTPSRITGYAQFPLAGGDFAFAGDRDLNRPFPLYGSFVDDTELVSLVVFIRSRPNNLQGPILHMDRQSDNSIRVSFRQGGNLLGDVLFRKQESTWIIVSSRGGGRA
jgi:hypothetical protein